MENEAFWSIANDALDRFAFRSIQVAGLNLYFDPFN